MNRSDVIILGDGDFIGTALANKFIPEVRQVCVLVSNALRLTRDVHFQQDSLEKREGHILILLKKS
jgi:5S rRNA maturation endonuclease (ribonuclease M5)